MKSNDEASSSKLVTDELSDVQPAVADDDVSTISSAGTAANCATVNCCPMSVSTVTVARLTTYVKWSSAFTHHWRYRLLRRC